MFRGQGEDALIHLLLNWKSIRNKKMGKPRSKMLEEVVEDLERAKILLDLESVQK